MADPADTPDDDDTAAVQSASGSPRRRSTGPRRKRPPSDAQRAWLARGATEPGGKLPLFDLNGRRVSKRVVEACMAAGWAERWFNNPLKPDWLVCRLTEAGRAVLAEAPSPNAVAKEKPAAPAKEETESRDDRTGDLFAIG